MTSPVLSWVRMDRWHSEEGYQCCTAGTESQRLWQPEEWMAPASRSWASSLETAVIPFHSAPLYSTPASLHSQALESQVLRTNEHRRDHLLWAIRVGHLGSFTLLGSSIRGTQGSTEWWPRELPNSEVSLDGSQTPQCSFPAVWPISILIVSFPHSKEELTAWVTGMMLVNRSHLQFQGRSALGPGDVQIQWHLESVSLYPLVLEFCVLWGTQLLVREKREREDREWVPF